MNEPTTKVETALARLERGESFDLEIEVADGLRAIARPYIREGRVHLEGTVASDGREVTYHVSTSKDDFDSFVEEARMRAIPLQIAAFLQGRYGRTPKLRRVVGTAGFPSFSSLPSIRGPSRILKGR